MKNPILLISILFLFACQSKTKRTTDIDNTATQTTIQPLKYIDLSNHSGLDSSLKSLVKQFINSHQINDNQLSDEDLSYMKKHIGKYPSDIDFLDIPIINSRLKHLTGEQFDNIEKCVVEAQIDTYSNDYVHISLCFPHECNKIYSEIYINTKTNNISLLFRNYDELYCYSEDGEMGLELDQWFQ